jgi:protein-S-isoprenylcysteine O-methyltransferase Ste14
MAEQERDQRTISAVAGLFFLAIYVVAGLDARCGWSNVPRALSIAANGLVAGGFGIVWLTFRANSYTSAVIEVVGAQRVVDRGPYAVVRHPMYSGAVLLLAATPVALGSWLALPWAIGLVFTIAVRSVAEENYLVAHLEGYDAYRARVAHRLVPMLW